jgi:hypothetical protein
VAALVDGVITGKSFAKMRVKPYHVAVGLTCSETNGMENSRRALGHERRTFSIPIFLHCFEHGFITCRLAMHKPEAILREVGAQHNEFFFVLVSSSICTPRFVASFCQMLLILIKLMNVAGPLVGPNGTTVYFHLIASTPWNASLS